MFQWNLVSLLHADRWMKKIYTYMLHTENSQSNVTVEKN